MMAISHYSRFSMSDKCFSVCRGKIGGGGDSRKKERKAALGNSYFKSKAVQGDKDPREVVSCGEPLLLSSVALGAVLFLLLF